MLTGYRTYIAAAAIALTGITCALQHYLAGDFSMHWQDCLKTISEGGGLAALRAAVANK